MKCFGILYVAFMEEFGSKAENAAWILAISNGLLLFGGKHSVADPGGARDARFSVQILSFSCSFRKKIGKTIS